MCTLTCGRLWGAGILTAKWVVARIVTGVPKEERNMTRRQPFNTT